MPVLKYLFVLALLCTFTACTWSGVGYREVPADFLFVLDASTAESGSTVHVNIQINAAGESRYKRYDSEDVIQGDENDMVVYSSDQILVSGTFKLRGEDLELLWEIINENNFFELTGDYCMAIGHAYAFIIVEANGRRHQVFNIGRQVPEIKAILEATQSMLPEEVEIEYGSGVML